MWVGQGNEDNKGRPGLPALHPQTGTPGRQLRILRKTCKHMVYFAKATNSLSVKQIPVCNQGGDLLF